MTTLKAFTSSEYTGLPRRSDFKASSVSSYMSLADHTEPGLNFHVWRLREGIFLFPVSPKKSTSIKQELDDLYRNCALKNWDGYGARPVYKSLKGVAEKFVRNLPDNIPDPEIGADPDGEISLDWYFSPQKVFSVSIGKKGRLCYAGLSGSKKFDGVDFFEKGIPSSILFHLRNLMK